MGVCVPVALRSQYGWQQRAVAIGLSVTLAGCGTVKRTVFGAPKEAPQFWRELAKVEQFDPARSLFVDDSLPVLRAARAAGIGLIYAVRCPDSSAPARALSEFPAVDAVAELL